MTLRAQAVSSELLDLLRRLMVAEPLQSFQLVGGTALALYFGHRISVDIDLFSDVSFDSLELSDFLSKEFGLADMTIEENTILGVLDGVKLDCMAHQYPMIQEAKTIEDIRLCSVEDIAAMKLNAIANRGCKKDFWDLYELMQHFSRSELLSFFEQKYPQSNLWTVEKSLVYFEDAEAEPDPVCLKERTWLQIKSEIQKWNRL